MKRIVFVYGIFLFINCCFNIKTMAQIECSGNQIFNEAKCKGDEIIPSERDLLRLINEYRVQNNLPPVHISDALSLVANRHLLDLEKNIKSMTHSWSNCPYDIKDQKTWNCLFTAPQRLRTDYTGRGYENIFHDIHKPANPSSALAAWKKSPLHNSLILNLGSFINEVYDACGVAIDGHYAILWFGTNGATQNSAEADPSRQLGVTFQQATNGLRNGVLFQQTWRNNPNVASKWIGTTEDKSIELELHGTKELISLASITVSVKIEDNKTAFATLLKNIVPNWTDGKKWSEESLKAVLKNPKNKQIYIVENKQIEMGVDTNKFVYLSIKPQK